MHFKRKQQVKLVKNFRSVRQFAKFWNCHYLIISVLRRQFVFTAQSNALPCSCPTHSVSLYSQPNLTPYRTAVPLISSVCIHSPIKHLALQPSNSFHHNVFSAQSNTLPYSCPPLSCSACCCTVTVFKSWQTVALRHYLLTRLI